MLRSGKISGSGYEWNDRLKKETQYNWRKILWTGILVCVLVYAFGEPYLEKWSGVDLPSIRDQGDNVQPYLTPTGSKNRLQSPAGLIYGMAAGGEHRVDHVMSHSRDDPSRPVHSVFEGTEQEILQVIDEAYALIKSKSNRVRSRPDDRLNFRVEHMVDLQRTIGYLGGQRGRRENHPPRTKITLVLDNETFVITAYPDQ